MVASDWVGGFKFVVVFPVGWVCLRVVEAYCAVCGGSWGWAVCWGVSLAMASWMILSRRRWVMDSARVDGCGGSRRGT